MNSSSKISYFSRHTCILCAVLDLYPLMASVSEEDVCFMQTLHLTQSSEEPGNHRVELALEENDKLCQTAIATFSFKLTSQDQEDIRWYLEDYLEYHQDPSPNIARRIERRMGEIGGELFKAIFQANEGTSRLWDNLQLQINNTQIDITTDVSGATAIPWELIRNPLTNKPLVIESSSFIRTSHNISLFPRHAATESGPIRILLVICRPDIEEDVPYRSVARRIMMELGKRKDAHVQLKVLRPSTFTQLKNELRSACKNGEPYHLVHFDGHGDFTAVDKENENSLAGSWRPGTHGYLQFEDKLVDGLCLGNLLAETNVPLLALNACRSAYSEISSQPISVLNSELMNEESQAPALTSLAQEIMDIGVPGIVAMRHAVDVTTVTQFFSSFYASLVVGQTLGEAVASGRRQLYEQPQREINYEPISFSDWAVPVVFGIASMALFTKREVENTKASGIENESFKPIQAAIDPQLPVEPPESFIGRDETILALDRRFDYKKIVLLQGYAGEGKTSAAADFARWYSLTGGINGPILFTSFEQYQPLSRVLDKLEQFFGEQLKWSGTNWLALNNDERRNVAIQVLKQYPVLWIWDNVEPIAGFPIGSESEWSLKERQELVEFLRDAQETQAKFLLTSRRDERRWLGNLTAGIKILPMPMRERMEMAISIAERRNKKLSNVEAWTPLLRYTQGNPLTITVLVGQALREGLKTKDQIEEFVAQLKTGEKEIEDEESLGRSRSLGASLGYGFQHAFNDSERKILAMLHFFQGYINVDVLVSMFDPEMPWHIDNTERLTRDEGIRILSRAADIGLLTDLGRGHYRIHAALPWYFRSIFQHYYPGKVEEAVRAFVGCMGTWGTYYMLVYESRHREIVTVLADEEANLLCVRRMALKNGWWDAVISAMQGIDTLYDHTGRWVQWKRLVEEIVPIFVDQKTDGPLSGREDDWNLVTEYRAKLAIRSWQLDKGLRLQKKLVEWNREKSGLALAREQHELDGEGRNRIRNYIVSLGDLARIQMKMCDTGCIRSYEEAIEKCKKYGFRTEAAAYYRNMGEAYRNLAEIQNLDKAEWCLRHGLEINNESDGLEYGRCLTTLGHIASERFLETLKASRPEKKHFEVAQEFYQQALDAFPLDAANELAATHNALGVLQANAGIFDEALRNYQEAIYYIDKLGDLYRAAWFRLNIAINLANFGRLSDALEYAQFAMEKFKECGHFADKKVRDAQDLIALIEEKMNSSGNQPT